MLSERGEGRHLAMWRKAESGGSGLAGKVTRMFAVAVFNLALGARFVLSESSSNFAPGVASLIPRPSHALSRPALFRGAHDLLNFSGRALLTTKLVFSLTSASHAPRVPYIGNSR